MVSEDFASYDFLINEEDEVMLLLYARENEPQKPTIEIDAENHSAILHRREDDSFILSDIPDDVLDSLEDADKLLVCELSIEEKEEDTQIIYAYEAELTD
ncbi:MAG: hypothetical protein E7012_02780 [Alphaproteobacteria bacterium]|nr:hypothetical protein [Alphaproteobacteria bacterium]